MSDGEDAKHRLREELSLIRKNGVCNNSAGCEGGEHLRDTENVLDGTCLQLLVLSQFMALNNDKLYIDSVALAGPAKGLQSGNFRN